MTVSYDVFTDAFLNKVTEYISYGLTKETNEAIVDGYMRRACSKFAKVCKYPISAGDNEQREFNFENISSSELDEIVDIVSDGMLVQWMKPYTYKQENLENLLNTVDHSAYSPAELLKQVTALYKQCRREFTNAIREYSYNHGDLTDLHL